MGDKTPYQEILKIFDALVVQVIADTQFRTIGFIPTWFPLSPVTRNSFIDPHEFFQRSFFLQCFMNEAVEFWKTQSNGMLPSGLWTEPALMRDESYLEATALIQEGERFLIVRRYQSDLVTLQSVLQKAREGHLAHGQEVETRRHREAQLGSQLAESEQIRDDVVAVLAHLQLATIMIDEHDAVSYASPAACRVFAMEEESLVGRLWTQVLPLTEEQRIQIQTQRGFSEGQRTSVAVSLKQKQKPRLEIELEVHDDPRDQLRTIFFLKDRTEVADLRRQLIGPEHFEKLIGKSPAMQLIYKKISEIAPVDVPVLIQGETGTGKDLVAQALHRLRSYKHYKSLITMCKAALNTKMYP